MNNGTCHSSLPGALEYFHVPVIPFFLQICPISTLPDPLPAGLGLFTFTQR